VFFYQVRVLFVFLILVAMIWSHAVMYCMLSGSVGVDHAVVRFFFFLKLRQSEFMRQATRWFRARWTRLVVPLAMVRTFFFSGKSGADRGSTGSLGGGY